MILRSLQKLMSGLKDGQVRVPLVPPVLLAVTTHEWMYSNLTLDGVYRTQQEDLNRRHHNQPNRMSNQFVRYVIQPTNVAYSG